MPSPLRIPWIHRGWTPALQARILDWVAIPPPRDLPTRISHIAGGFFTIWATREAQTSFWDTLNSDRAGKSISFFKSWIPNNFFSLLYHIFRLVKSLRCYPLRFLRQLRVTTIISRQISNYLIISHLLKFEIPSWLSWSLLFIIHLYFRSLGLKIIL